MREKKVKWDILRKLKNTKNQKPNKEEIINILLENRGLKTNKEKQEFFHPRDPMDFTLKELGIDEKEIKKAIARIEKAFKEKEQIIIYGDYDADGICATAIMWETLFDYTDKVLPYIPDRFSEGYGINSDSIANLKEKYKDLSLIITVDNGIVANEAVERAEELGIDVILSDHHSKGKKIPKCHAIVHTTNTSGAGVAWFLAREIVKKLQNSKLPKIQTNKKFKDKKTKPLSTIHDALYTKLELAAIGTIADQLPLKGVNRSIAKYGLDKLSETTRPGLLSLFREAGIDAHKVVGTYEVNYMIAPRLNAMGRMEHAIDSLRLLCTKKKSHAEKLSSDLGRTNKERQKVVEEVLEHVNDTADLLEKRSTIVLAHENYHEGVIGLAAGKLTEKYYRPAIVISKGKIISKASARSISGINIVETILSTGDVIEGGGGHPMAAGFSIKTERIEEFIQVFEDKVKKLLTPEILSRNLRIDCEISFDTINDTLYEKLKQFEPYGLGNPAPTFVSHNVNVLDIRTVGQFKKHLKMTLTREEKVFGAIGFNLGDKLLEITGKDAIDIAYTVDENFWNGKRTLQLKLKDIRTS